MNTPHHFGKDITLALIVKFALFALVWWLFFAGQKVHVNENSLSNRLLGTSSTQLK